MTIRPVGAEIFHVDRQTDIMNLIVVFHKFWNIPKNAVPASKITLCISYKEHSFNAVYRNCMKRYQYAQD